MLKVEEHGPVVKFLCARSILGRAVYHAAAYWVDGLLIDAGCAHTAAELCRAIAPFPLQHIVNTHSHEDHIGANGLLQRTRKVSPLAHPLALPILANPRLQPLQLYRRFFWGWPEPSDGDPAGEWIHTRHHRFQVIHTPGHSLDHICVHEAQQGWLFSGDTFIGGKDRAARPDYDMYAIIASLKKLASLHLTRLFPGSGTVRENPGDDLRRKAERLEELGTQVRHLYREGHTIPEIKRRVLGPEPYITYLTLGHFRGKYLIQSYLQGI
jgi:glyoxylase-like metal-dependent hydrolase (beta-lactamase superfamily II)